MYALFAWGAGLLFGGWRGLLVGSVYSELEVSGVSVLGVVYVCVFMYTCIYIYIYTHTYIYIYIYI